MSSLIYKKNKKFYILLCLPAIVFYTLSVLYPLIGVTLPASFFNWNILEGTKQFNGIENYIRLFKEEAFRDAMFFTLKLAVVTVLGSNILAFMVAYFLQAKIFAKGLSRAGFFIPNIINGIMVSFVWSFIFTQGIPILAKEIGFEKLASLSWFGTPSMAAVSVFIVTIWQGMGFIMIIYVAGMQSVSQELIEAAELDGCNRLQKVLYVVIPMMMPTITVCLFVSIAGAFKAFDIPFALTSGGPSRSTATVALNIYDTAFTSFRTGYASAKSIVLFILVMIVALIQLRCTRKKEVQL